MPSYSGARVRVACDIHDATRVWISCSEGQRICIATREGNSARYFSDAETMAAKEQRRQVTEQLRRLEKREESIRAQLSGLRLIECASARTDGAARDDGTARVEAAPTNPVSPAHAARRAQLEAEIAQPTAAPLPESADPRHARALEAGGQYDRGTKGLALPLPASTRIPGAPNR